MKSVLGLYGTSKAPYGSFAGKVENTAVELAAYVRSAITDATIYGLGAMTAVAYGLGAMTSAAHGISDVDGGAVHGRGAMTDTAHGRGDIG